MGRGSKSLGELGTKLARNTGGLLVDAGGGVAAKGIGMAARAGNIGLGTVAAASSGTAIVTGAAKRGINGQEVFDARSMLVDGTVGAVTGGLGQKIAPAMSALGTGSRAVASGTIGAVSGAGAQVAGNWATDRSLGEGVGDAAIGGAFAGTAAGAIGGPKSFAECTKRARAGESTVSAFTTKTPPPETDRAAYKAFTSDRNSWHPERRAFQDRAAEQMYQKALPLDAPMTSANKQPTLVIMRGNSGSGKSTALAGGSELTKKLGIPADAGDRALNPDALKPTLAQGSRGGEPITTGHTHVEAVMLSDRVTQRLLGEGRSMVLDRRFGTAQSVESVAKQAKAAGYKVVVLDIDAELATSASRVMRRPIGGDSPNVPFDAIRAGYAENRVNRAKVAALLQLFREIERLRKRLP